MKEKRVSLRVFECLVIEKGNNESRERGMKKE